MAEAEIKLSGWQAVAALVALAVVFVVRLMSFGNGLSDESLVEAVRAQLMNEYYPELVKKLDRAMLRDEYADMEDAVDSVLGTELTIGSIATSYPLLDFSSPRDVVVKVTYAIDEAGGGAAPRTAYYLYRYGAIGDNWQYRRGSSAFGYYMNFM